MTGVVSLTLMAVLIFVHVGSGRNKNINALDLEDTSFPLNTGASVPCGGQVDMRNSTSRHFQTPNYPQNYPKGKAGRCSWTFILPPNPKIFCEKFHVKKGDRLCIFRIKNDGTFTRRKCYYGRKKESWNKKESFKFPLHDVDVSSAFSNESKIKMVFRPNKRSRTGQGFKCAVAPAVQCPRSTVPGGHVGGVGGCNCGEAKRVTRIINGVDTEVNEYPWMVKIWSNYSICGGSIISPLHVLSAAHCVDLAYPQDFSVVVGEHDLGDTEESETQTIPVAEILFHPDYAHSDLSAPDIAILTLASPIAFSASAAPVCLPASVSPQPQYTGQVATVAGWGAVDNANTWNDILQEVQLTVKSNTECNATYVTTGGIDR